MPGLSALNITVQELLLPLLGARAHGVTLELEPAGPPLMLKPTVPTGALLVPPAVSATVTVQVSGVLGEVESGQSSVVCVDRAMTSTMSVPLLPAWIESAAGL